MPKYYCEYCDIYLMHSSLAGRRQHNAGRKHINNKIEYYQNLIREKGVTPPMYAAPPTLAARLRATKALQAQMAAASGAAAPSGPAAQAGLTGQMPVNLPGAGGARPPPVPMPSQAPGTSGLSGMSPMGGMPPRPNGGAMMPGGMMPGGMMPGGMMPMGGMMKAPGAPAPRPAGFTMPAGIRM